jgi:steroid delta-isomerase-like uncharacterized protein
VPVTSLQQVQANLDLVEEHITAEDLRDLEGLMATLTDDCIYRDFALRDPIFGKRGASQYYRDLWRLAPDFHFRVVHPIASPDVVALEVIGRGTHTGHAFGLPPTGRRFTLPMVWIFPARDGKLTGERVYFDGRSAMRQLGLLPRRGSVAEQLFVYAGWLAQRPGLLVMAGLGLAAPAGAGRRRL